MRSKGAAGLNTALGIAAVVLTVGFLFWLYQRSVSLEERVTPELEDAGRQGPVLSLEEFRSDPTAAIGRRVGMDSVSVASRLGRGVFTVRLDGGDSYPVLLHRDLIQRQMDLYGGDLVSLRGRVYTLNDSIRGEWVRAGAVDSAARANIPAATSFVLADSVDIW